MPSPSLSDNTFSLSLSVRIACKLNACCATHVERVEDVAALELEAATLELEAAMLELEAAVLELEAAVLALGNAIPACNGTDVSASFMPGFHATDLSTKS